MTAVDYGPRPNALNVRWVRDYEDVQEVMKSSLFANSLGNGHNRPISEDIVLVLTGDEHLTRRRTEIVMFSRAAQLEYEFDLVEPAVREMLESATTESEWAAIDLLAMSRSAMVRVSARVIGIDGIDSLETATDVLDISHRIGESFAIDFSNRPPDEIMADAVQGKKEFTERHFMHSMDRRVALIAGQADDPDAETPNDLLTLLLKRYPEWDDDRLIRECMFYLTASAGTSTHSIPHVVRHVAEWFDDNSEHLSLAGDISFLQKAVTETLRLYPPQPALSRVAMQDIELSSGTSFTRGEYILLDLNSTNRDARYVGDNPDEFDPFRTLATRTQRYVSSFGAGPHVCPGRLVAIGSGTGVVDGPESPGGAVTRLCHELFTYDVAIDPQNPPTLRTDTRSKRYGSFPILVRRRREGAGPIVTAKQVSD
jgi:cytochrome P450